MVRVDRGCNIDRELDLARLMEPLRKQPSLAWGEFESCKLHRGQRCPRLQSAKRGVGRSVA